MQGSKDPRGKWRTSDGDGEDEAEQDVRPMHAAAGRSLLRALALLLLHARHLHEPRCNEQQPRRKSSCGSTADLRLLRRDAIDVSAARERRLLAGLSVCLLRLVDRRT